MEGILLLQPRADIRGIVECLQTLPKEEDEGQGKYASGALSASALSDEKSA